MIDLRLNICTKILSLSEYPSIKFNLQKEEKFHPRGNID